MLRSLVGKIHNGLSLFAPRRSSPALGCFNEDPLDTAIVVLDDVMEGHSAVLAVEGEETMRFVVELHYLTDPAFLGLPERAKEEFGFKQKELWRFPATLKN